MAIDLGISGVNSVMSAAHFTTSSFIFSEIQQNENSNDSISFSISISFNRETFSFVLSSSEFQKKDNSDMVFVRGDTGDSTSFMEGVICSDTTCCTGTVGIGISSTLCTGAT